ncbi:DUF4390 domain-containing protein [Acidihalobacter prosperus]
MSATLGKWLFGLALGLAAAGFGQAEAAPDFQIVSAHIYKQNLVYYLDAKAHAQLDDKLRNALDNGVSLLLIYDIRVFQPGAWWWFDNTVATLSQRYRLRYHPLSRRYLVDNLNTGVSLSYARLNDALGMIDRLQGFPVLDQSLLPKNGGVVADVRLRVDTADFPLPLRVRAYFNDAWRPASTWYRCDFR